MTVLSIGVRRAVGRTAVVTTFDVQNREGWLGSLGGV